MGLALAMSGENSGSRKRERPTSNTERRSQKRRQFMKAVQGYYLIKPEDLSWRPSNLMKIPNADYLERTGSQNLGARL